MTAFTRIDLALKTLRQLNIIAIDEAPPSEVLADTLQTIGSEFARMEADGIVMWATTADSIDEVYFNLLADRMGYAIAPSYGIMDAATASVAKEQSENIIRRLAAPVKTPEMLSIPREARGTRVRDPLIQTP